MIKFLEAFFQSIKDDNPDIIGGVGWGSFHKFWSGGKISYPFLNAFSINKGFQKGLTSVDITITIADMVRQDESNLVEVENSTLQLIRDVYNIMKLKMSDSNIRVAENAQPTFFHNNGGDNVAGHHMNLTVSVFEGADLCNNLLKVSDSEWKDKCTGTVYIRDFDNNLVKKYDVACNEVYTYMLPEVLPCEDGTVIIVDSNGVNIGTQTVTSGGVGSFEVPDENITVNGDLLVTKPSAQDYNVEVVDSDDNPTGVISGGKVVVADTEKWVLKYKDQTEEIIIDVDAGMIATFASGSGANIGTMEISTDGVTYTPISYPFTPSVGAYYFKRSTALITATYTMIE